MHLIHGSKVLHFLCKGTFLSSLFKKKVLDLKVLLKVFVALCKSDQPSNNLDAFKPNRLEGQNFLRVDYHPRGKTQVFPYYENFFCF